MEKKKFNFKKFGLVLCVCFITLFAFIPFANFNKISSVSAATITDTDLGVQVNSTIDRYSWSLISMTNADGSNFSPSATYIWTDGNNLYYSSSSTQLVFNQSTNSWSAKTWTGLTSFSGKYIWTDGNNIYYSSSSTQYVLDISSSTWSAKTWTGLTSFSGEHVWTYKGNVYYSNGYISSKQYVLDITTSTWTKFVWTGSDFTISNYDNVYGSSFWTDGDNLYYSNNTYQYLVDVENFTFTPMTWDVFDGSTFNGAGFSVWTDGFDIYYDDDYFLDKSTNTWYEKAWGGKSTFSAQRIYIFKGIYYLYDGSANTYFIPFGYYKAGYNSGYELGYTDGYSAGYEAGVASSNSSDGTSIYEEGYKNGYNAGISTNSGYANGYDTGYNAGYNAGLSNGTNSGYKDGYSTGLTEGYNNGYNVGVNDSNQYTFYNLFGAVLDAPVRVFSDLFNFNLLGVNLLGLITGLITLAFVILIIKLCIGGK